MPHTASERKGLWVFWLIEDPEMHPWKILEFSKKKECEKGTNFRVFSTLEQCLSAFNDVASLKERQYIVIYCHILWFIVERVSCYFNHCLMSWHMQIQQANCFLNCRFSPNLGCKGFPCEISTVTKKYISGNRITSSGQNTVWAQENIDKHGEEAWITFNIQHQWVGCLEKY